MMTMPANSARNPIRTTRRGEASGKTFGIPAAASSSVMDSGSSRTPVATADSPSATDKNSGTAKNRPAWSRYWNRNEVRPPRSVRFRSMAGSTSTAPPRARRWFSHHEKTRSTSPPARISQNTGDNPSHAGAPALGWTNPHVPERKTPYTSSPRPSADSTVPTGSSRAPGSGGVSAMRRASAKMMSTIRTSPTNTHRQDR